ncbi:MAG: PAS domain S-box protein [Planctomycetota bacterium]|nr:PAS domain S-box protein [Planctomycetota bacterium]
MPTKLKVLILEDRAADAELMLHELRRAGYEPEWKRVQTEPEYLAQLDQGFEIILADYSLPKFNGLRALELLRERGLDIPFIIVSGAIGEDKAVAVVKAGANDYVMKDRLARLGTAVERELRNAVERRERKRAEEVLRESESKLRTILETVQAGIVIIDPDTHTIVDVNPMAAKLIGETKERIVGSVCHRFICPAEEGKCPITDLKQTVDNSERVLLKADGTRIPIVKTVVPFGLGGRQCLLESFADTSLLKRAEEVLRATDERFRQIVETAQEGILSVDAQFRTTYVNQRMADLLGYPPAEMIGRPMTDFIPPEGLPDHTLQMRSRVQGLASQYERRFRRKDGAIVTLLVSATPLFDTQKRFAGSFGMFTDLTEHKRLELQFRQAQKMEAVGRLAGGVAHDFNNMLFVINGRAELAMDGLKAKDPLRAQLKLIHETGGRAANLTRQLLAFSRRQTLQPKVLDLNAVVTDMSKMLFRLIREDITMKMVLYPALRPTQADPGQVEQVLMNLVVNARDAMPKNGTLTIETANAELDEAYCRTHAEAKPGRYVMLAVSDTGCGMDDDVKARIFEPFFTTKELGQGTGLGLATVYGIVKQSDGHIAAYSEVGKGTTFKIYLPETAATPARDSHAIKTIVPRGTETILLVEDEEEVRILAHELLESNGYKVLLARNGIEALSVCKRRKGKIDMIITDVVMPRMNGPEMAQRASGLCPGVKVLFISGYTDGAVSSNGLLSSDTNYLQKPFTSGTLARKVREVLDFAAEPTAATR